MKRWLRLSRGEHAALTLMLMVAAGVSGYNLAARRAAAIVMVNPGDMDEYSALRQEYGPDLNSEHAEEWIVRNFFKDAWDGVFVDVGANHHQRFSNTYYLETSLLPLALPVAAIQNVPASWLDRPLEKWNRASDPVPDAPAGDETTASVISRCQLTPPRSTAAERTVDAAGWIPFWNFDRQVVDEDVEIVGGMRGADGMCRPVTYNLFVFIGGRFAGVLSPTPMTARMDSSSGVVRLPLPAITAEFARYASTDALCCPSSRVTVRYRIDRTPAGPVVAPVDVRTTRP